MFFLELQNVNRLRGLSQSSLFQVRFFFFSGAGAWAPGSLDFGFDRPGGMVPLLPAGLDVFFFRRHPFHWQGLARV